MAGELIDKQCYYLYRSRFLGQLHAMALLARLILLLSHGFLQEEDGDSPDPDKGDRNDEDGGNSHGVDNAHHDGTQNGAEFGHDFDESERGGLDVLWEGLNHKVGVEAVVGNYLASHVPPIMRTITSMTVCSTRVRLMRNRRDRIPEVVRRIMAPSRLLTLLYITE